MKWILKVIAGGARALVPVPLLAAFMVLAAGSAQAQNSNFTGDSPPIGGTEASELHVIVAAMGPRIAIDPLGAVVCNAIFNVEVRDTKDLGGDPVATVTDALVSAGGKLMLTHVFAPSGGDQRQDVVIRVTLTAAPNVATSLAAFRSICSFVGSAQVVDTASGATQLVISLSLGWHPD